MSTDVNESAILVVDDEWMIAEVLAQMLAELDLTNVTCAHGLEQGLAAVEDSAFALAILDVNLGAALVFPLAERLKVKGVPLFFATARVKQDLPEQWQDHIVLAKPVALDELSRAVRACTVAH